MDFEEIERLEKRVAEAESRLDRVEDERAIKHAMYRYIYACDELKNPDIIASLFTDDAVWEGKGNFSEFGKTIGRDAIRKMFEDNPIVLPFTAHFLTNPIVVLSLSGHEGWGQWHTLEAATLRDERAQVWIAAWYDNDFQRVGDDWKIAHLRYEDSFVAPYEEGWMKVRYVSPLTLSKHGKV